MLKRLNKLEKQYGGGIPFSAVKNSNKQKTKRKKKTKRTKNKKRKKTKKRKIKRKN